MNNKSLFRYFTFGLKYEWILDFLNRKESFFYNNNLGPIQRLALKNYLLDIEFINKDNSINQTLILLVNKNINQKFKYEIIWVNLSFNSNLFNFWNSCGEGKYERKNIIELLAKLYGKYNRSILNAYQSLVGTLENTPIGSELKQGKVIRQGRNRIVIKEGNPDISPYAIAYNIFKFSERNNRFQFTLEDIENETLSPQKIFTISTEKTKNLLQQLWDTDFYTVEFKNNKQVISLNNKYSCLDILKYYGERL